MDDDYNSEDLEVSDEDMMEEESDDEIEFICQEQFQPIVSRQHAASIIQAMRSRSTIQTPRGQRSTHISDMSFEDFNGMINEKQSLVYGSPSDHSSDEDPIERHKDFSIYYAPKVNPNAVPASRRIPHPPEGSMPQGSPKRPAPNSPPLHTLEEVDTDSDWVESGSEDGESKNTRSTQEAYHVGNTARQRSRSRESIHSNTPGPPQPQATASKLKVKTEALSPSGSKKFSAPVTPNFTQDELAFYKSIMRNAPRKPGPTAVAMAPKTAWVDSSSDDDSDSPPNFTTQQTAAMGLEDPLEESAGFYLSDEDLGPNDIVEYLEEEFQPNSKKSGPRLDIKSAPSKSDLHSTPAVPEVGSEEWVKVQYKKRLKQARRLAREEMRKGQTTAPSQENSPGKSLRRKKKSSSKKESVTKKPESFLPPLRNNSATNTPNQQQSRTLDVKPGQRIRIRPRRRNNHF